MEQLHRREHAEADSYAIGDINGDGKPHCCFRVATPIYSDPVYFVALGNGDGTFQTPVPYAFPQIAPTADFDISNTVSSLEIADVKNDGNAEPDLRVQRNCWRNRSNPYNQGIVVLPGNGNGTFKAPAYQHL